MNAREATVLLVGLLYGGGWLVTPASAQVPADESLSNKIADSTPIGANSPAVPLEQSHGSASRFLGGPDNTAQADELDDRGLVYTNRSAMPGELSGGTGAADRIGRSAGLTPRSQPAALRGGECDPPNVLVSINIMTDEYPEEITWELVEDDSNNVLCAGGPYDQQHTLYQEQCCVASDGCYAFVIHDSWGDGICCAYGSGYYEVFYDGTLVDSGGEFAYMERTYFAFGGGCFYAAGACCLGEYCAATSTEAECLDIGGEWHAGVDCDNFECPPACPTNAWFGQRGNMPEEPWTYSRSNSDEGNFGESYVCDNFADVAGPILTVRWSGMFYSIATGRQADNTGQDFQITFYEDDDGEVGEEVSSYVIEDATMTPSGLVYSGIERYDMEAELDPPCFLTDGWIRIIGLCGTNAGGGFFYWLGSDNGLDGHSVVGNYRQLVCGTWDDLATDQTLCLLGDNPELGACCDPYTATCVDGVTYDSCADGEFFPGLSCSDIDCGGGLGACCDEETGVCEDDVLRANCDGHFESGAQCADMACGEALGVCCIDGSCAGVTTQPDCVVMQGMWFETDTDCARFECPLTCAYGTLYGRRPKMPDDDYRYFLSSTAYSNEYELLDRFTGVSEPIHHVRWWGNPTSTDGNYYPCDPSGMDFVIRFYEDDDGAPGEQVFEQAIADVPYTSTGVIYYDTWPLYEFAANINPCNLETGWVSIQGTESDNGCALWLITTADRADGMCYSYKNGSPTKYLGDYDVSFCLLGELPTLGACCDPASGTCVDDLEEDDCAEIEGHYFPGRTCAEINCGGATGACCDDEIGDCLDDVYAAACAGPLHRFHVGQICAEGFDPPCGSPLGACCMDRGECMITTEAECYAGSEENTWRGPYSTCEEGCPCLFECDDSEGEGPCYDGYVDTYNGGCNYDPAVFQPIANGETVCGQSGFYSMDSSTYRDMDWYEFELTEPSVVEWTVNAEFGWLVVLIDATEPDACETLPIVAGASTFYSCTPYTATTACLPTGTYWLIATIHWYSDYAPCGSQYDLTLNITPCDDLITGACCLSDGTCLQVHPDRCDGHYWGDYTRCEQVHCTGACCHPDGLCSDVVEDDCFDNFRGYETTCEDTQCVPNDSCEYAILVDVPSSTIGTTEECSPVDDQEYVDGFGFQPLGVWYRVVGTGNTMSASVMNDFTNENGPEQVGITVLCECNPNDWWVVVDGGTVAEWCTEAGKEYLIRVWSGCFLYCECLGTAPFQLDISDDGVPCDDPPLCGPCDTCEPGFVPEDEPGCGEGYVDEYNGGCGAQPTTPFQPLEVNTTICGLAGRWDEYERDEDWYEVVIEEDSYLTFEVSADFRAETLALDAGTGNCLDYTTLASTTADRCGDLTLDLGCVLPGTYWFGVRPQLIDSNYFDCDTRGYLATVLSEPCVAERACCYGDDPVEQLCEDLSAADCDALGGEWYSAEHCASFECPPLCEETAAEVHVMTDNYPYQTTWEFVDRSDDSVVGSGGPYASGNTLYVERFCLEAGGCYDFTIFDSRADGICCEAGEGYYEIYYAGNLVCDGGDFGSSEVCIYVGDCSSLGDIDGDGDVDLADLAALLGSYGSCTGDPDFNEAADLDGNGCVELADLATLLSHYGE